MKAIKDTWSMLTPTIKEYKRCIQTKLMKCMLKTKNLYVCWKKSTKRKWKISKNNWSDWHQIMKILNSRSIYKEKNQQIFKASLKKLLKSQNKLMNKWFRDWIIWRWINRQYRKRKNFFIRGGSSNWSRKWRQSTRKILFNWKTTVKKHSKIL